MRVLLLALALTAGGCDGTEAESPALPSDCALPNRIVGDRCLAPGVQDNGCPAGTLGLEDGSCQPAGIPPEMCGKGFEPDGNMGCEPILPAEACPAGEMAVPGESACHSVMECGAGKWGDIPVDAMTVYVDASYLGADSDGSSAKPFITISSAVAAAASNALISIAAGSYVEDVTIDKPVRLWGKCPGEVELVGTSAGLAALIVRDGASGTEVHGLALGGASRGIGVSGAEGVLVDQVWVHDALGRGVVTESVLGPTSITLRGSLIEKNHDVGVFMAGSEGTLESVVIRGTLPRASDQLSGRGINIQVLCSGTVCNMAQRSTVFVRGSLVEANHEGAVAVRGSDATLEDLVVRNTFPRSSDQSLGWGIVIQAACTELPCDPALRSTAVVRGSLVEQNHDLGMLVAGADATLEGVLVRNTLPSETALLHGRGIHVQPVCDVTTCDPATRTTLRVRASRIEENHDHGVFVMGSDATLEGIVIRGTRPEATNEANGSGLHIQLICMETGCDSMFPAAALVRGSRVEENHTFGVLVGASDATLEGVLVRGTLARQADALYGDGVATVIHVRPASRAMITGSRIESSARAGVSNFGATVTLGTSALACNAFDLAGETYQERLFDFESLGDNACGCPDATGPCKLQSGGLEPPEPLGSQ